MRIRTYCTLLLVVISEAAAGLRDPFPSGFSMGTLGAVIDDRGAGGREPWTSAALCGDTSGFGFGLTGTSYYGAATGSMGKEGIAQAAAGGWYARKHLICKASIASLTAFSTYFEQSGFISCASDHLKVVRMGLEFTGSRLGVRVQGSPTRTIAETGVSAWVPLSWAALSLRMEHIALETAETEGADPPFALRCGLHTAGNRFGGQGALVTITPGQPRPVCFTVGEEYCVTPAIAFRAALSNNPLFLSFGMAYAFGRTGVAISLVNHPLLGWSQGFGAEYCRKKQPRRV
jgi:hypothetical protein